MTLESEKKNMMYIIIKEKHYSGIENSYDIINYTDSEDKAQDMLKGYQLINQEKSIKYAVIKYNPFFAYKKEREDE